MHGSRSLTITLLLVSLVGACSSGDGTADAATTNDRGEGTAAEEVPATTTAAGDSSGEVFPSDEWAVLAPAEAGLDPAVLEDVAADAEAGGSNCLVVTRGGRLVDEWYWNATGPDTSQEVFSASKSFTSTMVGIAVDAGDLEVTDHASTWIPEWVGTPSESVTVEQLLSNTSGRHHDLGTDYGRMAAQAEDKTALAISLGQDAEPGTTWVYNNSSIQTLEQVMESATGEDLADFAEERLFAPLGMDDTDLARDRAGNPMTFMGIQSTCRDMARFGLMALRQGRWDGEQVVSADWMERATGHSSQELNAAYGWLWWLNRPGPVLGALTASGGAASPDGPGHLVDGAPEDMFFALGLGGQVIAIDPGSETVVVRLGPSVYPDGIRKFGTDDAARIATEAVTGEIPPN